MSGSKRLCIRSTCTVNVQAWETTLQPYECSLFYFFYFSGCRKINGHWMYFKAVFLSFFYLPVYSVFLSGLRMCLLQQSGSQPFLYDISDDLKYPFTVLLRSMGWLPWNCLIVFHCRGNTAAVLNPCHLNSYTTWWSLFFE